MGRTYHLFLSDKQTKHSLTNSMGEFELGYPFFAWTRQILQICLVA